MDPPPLDQDGALVVQRPVDLGRLDVPVVWGLPLHQALVYAGLMVITATLLGRPGPGWLKPWMTAALWAPTVAALHLSLEGLPLWRWAFGAARFLASARTLPPLEYDPKEVSFHP